MIERAEHRQRYRLVGLQHELEFWKTPHQAFHPIPEHFSREYDPAEMADTEKWITVLFEPVLFTTTRPLSGAPFEAR